MSGTMSGIMSSIVMVLTSAGLREFAEHFVVQFSCLVGYVRFHSFDDFFVFGRRTYNAEHCFHHVLKGGGPIGVPPASSTGH